jgi:hypothetical protein
LKVQALLGFIARVCLKKKLKTQKLEERSSKVPNTGKWQMFKEMEMLIILIQSLYIIYINQIITHYPINLYSYI